MSAHWPSLSWPLHLSKNSAQLCFFSRSLRLYKLLAPGPQNVRARLHCCPESFNYKLVLGSLVCPHLVELLLELNKVLLVRSLRCDSCERGRVMELLDDGERKQ